MEIKRKILNKYLEQAAIEQLISEYQQSGYEVIKEIKEKDFRADLILKKDDDIIVFEIKTGNWGPDKQKKIIKQRNLAIHELGARFKIVLVKIPEEPDIVVNNIEGLFNELLLENFASEFSELATHHWIDEISDIHYTKLFIDTNEIEIKGSSLFTLGLQYGSDGDFKRGDGHQFYEPFTFQFNLLLDAKLNVSEVINLKLDTPDD